MSWRYGKVESQLPIMPVLFGDTGLNNMNFSPSGKISRSTATVVLTHEHLYFGDVESFTEKFSDVRNKFYISHTDGRPELGQLVETMSRWMKVRISEKKPVGTDVAVLLPSSEIPVPIVIQTLHWLKKSGLFSEIVLASELR